MSPPLSARARVPSTIFQLPFCSQPSRSRPLKSSSKPESFSLSLNVLAWSLSGCARPAPRPPSAASSTTPPKTKNRVLEFMYLSPCLRSVLEAFAHDFSHFFQSGDCHGQGVLLPVIAVEQLQRQHAAK